MLNRVYVTGIGIVSAIGDDADSVLKSLCSRKSGLGFTNILETIHKNEFPVGEVKLSNNELSIALKINSSKFYTRTSLLGLYAAKQALENSGLTSIPDCRTGLISANSVGGMDRSEIFFKDFLIDNKKGKLRNIIGHDSGDSTEKIASYLKINDYVTTISTACSSSANAIMLGARLIKNNVLDRVIVGGTDALTVFTINGFNSLMVLDNKPTRPFDDTRNGINLGEGAAYLVLESEDVVNNTNKAILCEVKGYGNACDAFHQTASSPEGKGAFLAMKKALEVAELKPEEIDYINAHGTGTPNNDLTEGNALINIFGSQIPMFSSTKPYTGHTLGASGAIEAVLCVLAIKNNIAFPNLNFEIPMKESGIIPLTEIKENISIKNVLSNSFGFGGNNTSLIFSAC